jgi:hypothetical protein
METSEHICTNCLRFIDQEKTTRPNDKKTRKKSAAAKAENLCADCAWMAEEVIDLRA